MEGWRSDETGDRPHGGGKDYDEVDMPGFDLRS
jgi:hypothetical protein